MGITTKHLLELSQSMIAANVDEAQIRCSIGRSYYAAFHCAKDFHLSLSRPGALAGRPAGVHETLYQQLAHPTISQTDPNYLVSKQIAFIARELKGVRVDAGYALEKTIDLKLAQRVIKQTLQLKALVDSRAKLTATASPAADTLQPSQPHTLAS